ncbi:squalene synthase HpnD [Pseudolabrys taiwanensis]|uniref:Squalene synthase HpnD n=1 Tax=Pseudolabrys taiwanensis TaxID=331696 RepID=A0A346A188_9HYPH|nr:presqualene diphosphate synthase HpnD [Pseudolabrys taiwanensis]AXK82935.1 squalene synthase HpnD [Pseudolabrys taiwanensis]
MSAPAQQNETVAAKASGSSFYLAMRILPREQRQAMYEIYSFCRAVDDIADSDLPRAQRQEQLAQWRRDIEGLYEGKVLPGHEGLTQAIRQFGLRQEDFLAVIDGMEMDAIEDIRAPAFETLDTYCDRVASAVGRLSVRVFGMEEGAGIRLAHHLGRALQMTNILRDVDEDAGMGRLYLPREALTSAGILSDDPAAVLADPALGKACDVLVARARQHYAEADAVMAKAPRRAVRAPRIMSEAYRRVLDDLVARGWTWPRNRVHVSRAHLLKVALRHAFL